MSISASVGPAAATSPDRSDVRGSAVTLEKVDLPKPRAVVLGASILLLMVLVIVVLAQARDDECEEFAEAVRQALIEAPNPHLGQAARGDEEWFRTVILPKAYELGYAEVAGERIEAPEGCDFAPHSDP